MTTTAAPTYPAPSSPPARFHNAAEWWHALGDVPLERIVMNPAPGTATEEDLLRLVEGDLLVELVDGTLVQKPVGWEESQIAVRLILALGTYVMPRKLGAVAGADGTLRMRSGRVRLPDVCFVSAADLPPPGSPRRPIPTLPPTIAAEVISPGNTKAEMLQKRHEYFSSGARLVWLIQPTTRTVEVFTTATTEPARILTENDVLDGGIVLPGFSMPVASLFESVAI